MSLPLLAPLAGLAAVRVGQHIQRGQRLGTPVGRPARSGTRRCATTADALPAARGRAALLHANALLRFGRNPRRRRRRRTGCDAAACRFHRRTRRRLRREILRDRGDLRVSQLRSDVVHLLTGIGLARSALPRMQRLRRVGRHLACERREQRRLADTLWAVAVDAPLDVAALVPHGDELHDVAAACGSGRVRACGVRIERRVILRHGLPLLGLQLLRDRRHDRVAALAVGVQVELPRKIRRRLRGKAGEAARGVAFTMRAMASRARRATGALRCDRGTRIGRRRRRCAGLRERRGRCRAKGERKEQRGRAHACTSGPGAFTYCFTIASAAQ